MLLRRGEGKKLSEILALLVIFSISLAALATLLPAVSADTDSDGDGIPDLWEAMLGTNSSLWTNTDGTVYTEASVNPEEINLGETTTVTLRAIANETTGKSDVDVVLVTDLSGSMNSPRSGPTKLDAAKDALETFVGLGGDEMYIGLASFSDAKTPLPYSDATWQKWLEQENYGTSPFHPYAGCSDKSKYSPKTYHDHIANGYSDAHIDINFTQDKAALYSTINSYNAKGGTNIGGGINAAKKLLEEQGTPGNLQVIIVMSDGIATMAPIEPDSLDAYMPSDWVNDQDQSETGRIAAREAADVVKEQDIVVYSIGFGSDADADTLADVASSEDKYYYAPTNAQLADVYSEISAEIKEIAGARAYHVLPTNVAYINGSASTEPDINGQTLEWVIGDLTPKAPWVVTFDVKPLNPGNQSVNVMPDSKVTYAIEGNSTLRDVPFPAAFVDVKTPPVADFSWMPAEPYEHSNVIFTANASDPDGGDIVSYEWDFGDGGTATGETATYVFGDEGDYAVTLTVTDDEGVSASVIKTVGVSALSGLLPPVAIFTVSNKTPTTNQSVMFDASESYDPDGTIVAYRWDFDGDDSWDEEGEYVKLSHVYDAEGSYTAKLEVEDNDELISWATEEIVVGGVGEPLGNVTMVDSGISATEGKRVIGQTVDIQSYAKVRNTDVNTTADVIVKLYVDGVLLNQEPCTLFPWTTENITVSATWIPMSSGKHSYSIHVCELTDAGEELPISGSANDKTKNKEIFIEKVK